MILRDRCSTSYDLASLFRGRRSSLDRRKSQNAMVRGCRLCPQLSIFEGSLAELLRFLMSLKMEGFCSMSKNDGRRGTFEEDLQRCIFRGRRSTRDMFIRAVRRSGRWFPERGCILEPQIFRFAEMILRDRCSTSYDLASLFRGRRSSLDRWSGKITKRIGTRLSALHSTFHFWRTSRRIASFWMLSSSKIEEVSQNSCVFKLADR